MLEARKAVIKSESLEKTSRALRPNIRSYKDIYYKRTDSKRCSAPGKITGVEGQQILMKHSSFYVRRHPSRAILKFDNAKNRPISTDDEAKSHEENGKVPEAASPNQSNAEAIDADSMP